AAQPLAVVPHPVDDAPQVADDLALVGLAVAVQFAGELGDKERQRGAVADDAERQHDRVRGGRPPAAVVGRGGGLGVGRRGGRATRGAARGAAGRRGPGGLPTAAVGAALGGPRGLLPAGSLPAGGAARAAGGAALLPLLLLGVLLLVAVAAGVGQ